MRSYALAGLSLLFLAAALTAASPQTSPSAASVPEQAALDQASLRPFGPLPPAVPGANGDPSHEMVTLGRWLFFEPRLSMSQTISCNSCHDLANYGVDGQVTSPGHKGQRGDRNSPTVYNAAGHVAQFWDGRAADVEAQAKGPILNPVEMAMPDEARVLAVLESMPEYVAAFQRAFPGEPRPVSYANMAKAIGAFERRLMTPSRWDALLAGDQSALSPAEKQGFQMFVATGCQLCHDGALLGGTRYQRLGVMKTFPRAADPGRRKVTHEASDQSVFKVPSLRNVEKTAPYFHDGATASLNQAVRDMAEYQLGKTLTDDEVGRITDFLKVLTGKIDPDYIRPPELPRSSPTTPRPVTSH